MVGDYCPACGEGVFDASESARVSAAMLAFRRFKPDDARSVNSQVEVASGDAGALDADEMHGDALRETERRYAAGQEQPIDWAVAKQELRKCGE